MKDFFENNRNLVLLFVATFLLVMAGLHMSAKNIIISGIMFAEERLDGFTYAKANTVISEKSDEILSQRILFSYNGLEKESNLKRLGYEINLLKTLDNIHDSSYGNNFFDHLGNRIYGLFLDKEVPASFDFDFRELGNELVTLYPQLHAPVDAKISIDDNRQVNVIPHDDGYIFYFEELEKQIDEAISLGIDAEAVEISVEEAYANYLTEDAEADAKILMDLLENEYRFYFTEGKEYTFEYITKIDPSWVEVYNREIIVDEDKILEFISTNISPQVEKPASNAIIKALPAEGEYFATVEGIAKNGLNLIEEEAVNLFSLSLKRNIFDIPLLTELVTAEIINETGEDLGELTFLALGKTGYWGSGGGRAHNIQKGIRDLINNLLIAPEQSFSFNDNLGELNSAGGWAYAHAIFGGNELISVPAGGLCQVSTTMYRTLLGAGLEILERSPHTLYIYYYEEYGNGLDATVFPGWSDLRFKNNSDGYLLFQAYTEDDIAYVNVFGTPIYEKVELIGPIYSGRVPDRFKDLIDPSWNEIAWIQKYTDKDGETSLVPLVTKYKTKPRKMYGYDDDELDLSLYLQ